jgi:hypothetical protein
MSSQPRGYAARPGLLRNTLFKEQTMNGKMPAKPDLDHRSWVANLKEDDRVEVPYSLAKEDIKLMTVYKNDGVWIRLLPDGFRNAVENTVLVDAVSGVLHYASARIVPSGTMKPIEDHNDRAEKLPENMTVPMNL